MEMGVKLLGLSNGCHAWQKFLFFWDCKKKMDYSFYLRSFTSIFLKVFSSSYSLRENQNKKNHQFVSGCMRKMQSTCQTTLSAFKYFDLRTKVSYFGLWKQSELQMIGKQVNVHNTQLYRMLSFAFCFYSANAIFLFVHCWQYSVFK